MFLCAVAPLEGESSFCSLEPTEFERSVVGHESLVLSTGNTTV